MKKRLLTLTTVMVLGGIPQMFAQSVGPFACPTAFLSEYDTVYRPPTPSTTATGCTVGTNLEFTAFTFSSSGTGANSDLDSVITVTPDPDGLGGGFTFSGWENIVEASESAVYTIGYTYSIFGDPPTVDAASLGMDPISGSVTIGQQICASGFDCFNEGVNSTQPPHDGCGGLPNLNGTCWIDSTSLPNISGATSTNTITLTGNGDGAGFDAFDAIYHVAPDPDAAPEPMTSILALGGLVAIGLVRRYRIG